MYTHAINKVINDLKDYSRSQGRVLTDAQTAFVATELSQILPKTLEKRYPALRGREFVSLDGSYPSGAEVYYKKVYDRKGLAQIGADPNTQLPNLSVVADSLTIYPFEVSGFYAFTMRELESAALAQVPLETIKAENARLQIETAIDSIIAVGGTQRDGSTVTSQTGLLNNANVGQFTFQNDPWGSASAAQVLADLSAFASSVFVDSKTAFSANRVLLSPRVYQFLAQTPYSTVTGQSILSNFKENFGFPVTVDAWYKLEDFHGDGYDAAVVYDDNQDVVSFGNPVPYQEVSPQFVDLTMKVAVRSVVTPPVVTAPIGMKYGIIPTLGM